MFQLARDGQYLDVSFDVLCASSAGRMLLGNFSSWWFLIWLWRYLRRNKNITPLHLRKGAWDRDGRRFNIVGSCPHFISMSEMNLKETALGKKLLLQYHQDVRS